MVKWVDYWLNLSNPKKNIFLLVEKLKNSDFVHFLDS